MNEVEKKICDDVLRDGTITRDEEFDCEGKVVRQYAVEYAGEEYLMTKYDGEWIYFHHTIRKK